jgi:hypothetical protein
MWSLTVPSEPGFYWFRQSDAIEAWRQARTPPKDGHSGIALIDPELKVFLIGTKSIPPSFEAFEWWDRPITPPEGLALSYCAGPRIRWSINRKIEDQYRKAAEAVANLVEDGAWDHLSENDETKAIAIIRDVLS